jgi:signal transduction histidine kinase
VPFNEEILIVDDRRENLTAIEAALVGFNNQLVFADSGAEALRNLLERSFALILLDVQMPGMNGFETARMIRARERSKHVPIIFITAFDSSDDDVLEAYKLGAVDFLFKPVDPDVLRAKAAVFVELQRRSAEISRQAEKLRESEQRAHEQELAEQRRRLEAEALRQSLARQREYTVNLEDIHARLERSNAQLADADRRKDEFIAVLAHELRNPLGALINGLEVLSDEQPAAMLVRVKAIMQRQCDHLSRLVDDLLDISRITSGKMELQQRAVTVRSIIDDAVGLVTLSIDERRHLLEVSCECPDAVVNGDPVRLSQIVANLLSNAARYTDPDGRIWLNARREPEGERVCISVRDNGRGMNTAKIERAFQMFVQERTGGGGLGIGLPLVRRLTELHGGTVTGHSDGPGQGSTFEIHLPEAVGVVETPVDDVSIRVDRRLRISLVDDHDDLREMTGSMLKRWGHEVSEAATGEAGVELVLEVRPDVAIIDIGLPDIDGYDVARRLRAALGDQCPRLISFSGHSLAKDAETALEAGFDAHLSKPANAARLQAAMFEPGE